MNISLNETQKEEILKKAKKWVYSLEKLTKKEEPGWWFIAKESTETFGKIQALWELDLISDEEWEKLFDKTWDIYAISHKILNLKY